MMNNLRPIKLLPARERVASALRKAIFTRELSEGTTITLDGIATQLEVSNTPVREAFQILCREGIITQRPNKVAEVMGISRKLIQDHYETRALLESASAGAVCRNGADTGDIQNVHENSKAILAAGNISGYADCNQALHFAIWEAAGNNKMKLLLAELWNGFSLGHLVTEEDYAKVSIAEHIKIVEAIISKNESLAKELMYAHIIRSMNDVLTNFS